MESSKAMSTVQVNETTLMKMKSVYQEEVAEYKVLYQLYNQEKEKARQERRLRSFPPFEKWVPKGRALSGREEELLAGPHSSASIVPEYVHEEKGRRPHTFKAEKSIICQLGLPALRFGTIENILLHKFAGCQYVWFVIGWFPPPKYHPESRLWFSEDVKVEHTSPILISKASQPLVIAKDEDLIWFLDAPVSGNQ